MGNYAAYVKDKNAEHILAHDATSDSGPIGEYLRVSAQVRSGQELLMAQNLCASNLTASILKLVGSLDQASKDSGKLGRKIAWLTGFLVAVGVGQIIAIAWPYLPWWWHHLWNS
jgi:hypothetical protein